MRGALGQFVFDTEGLSGHRTELLTKWYTSTSSYYWENNCFYLDKCLTALSDLLGCVFVFPRPLSYKRVNERGQCLAEHVCEHR